MQSKKAHSIHDFAVIPPRKLRREAAQEVKYQNRNKLIELSAGQIWDIWAVKLNAYISRAQIDQTDAMERVSDVIFGGPELNEKQKQAFEKREKDRLKLRERTKRKQSKALLANQTTLFGPQKTQTQLQEEVRQQEEAELQLEQLSRLEERFEGILTLL